jgi:hypothetical protein
MNCPSSWAKSLCALDLWRRSGEACGARSATVHWKRGIYSSEAIILHCKWLPTATWTSSRPAASKHVSHVVEPGRQSPGSTIPSDEAASDRGTNVGPGAGGILDHVAPKLPDFGDQAAHVRGRQLPFPARLPHICCRHGVMLKPGLNLPQFLFRHLINPGATHIARGGIVTCGRTLHRSEWQGAERRGSAPRTRDPGRGNPAGSQPCP